MAKGFKSGGRKPGTLNKVDARTKDAIADFMERHLYKMDMWLEQIEKESPTDAFAIFLSLIEFVRPKLARAELTGKDGERLSLTVTTGVISSVKQIESDGD